jgi:hypothetical protein
MEGWTKQQFRGADEASLAAISSLWTRYFELPWIMKGQSDEVSVLV